MNRPFDAQKLAFLLENKGYQYYIESDVLVVQDPVNVMIGDKEFREYSPVKLYYKYDVVKFLDMRR